MGAPLGNKYAEGAGGGRPSEYTPEIADQICGLTASTSKSIKTIAGEVGVDVTTIYRWLRLHEEFYKEYTRAKTDQADLLAEEILEIADDGSNDFMTITKGDESYEVENKEVTARSRLRVESRKWLASKLKPKKYSERMEHTGAGGEPLMPQAVQHTVVFQDMRSGGHQEETENTE